MARLCAGRRASPPGGALALGADLAAWLALVPGSVILAALAGLADPEPVAPALVYAVMLAAFGFLLLSLIAGLARDSLERDTPGAGAHM